MPFDKEGKWYPPSGWQTPTLPQPVVTPAAPPAPTTGLTLAERLRAALQIGRPYTGLAPQIETTLPGDIAPPPLPLPTAGPALPSLPTVRPAVTAPVARQVRHPGAGTATPEEAWAETPGWAQQLGQKFAQAPLFSPFARGPVTEPLPEPETPAEKVAAYLGSLGGNLVSLWVAGQLTAPMVTGLVPKVATATKLAEPLVTRLLQSGATFGLVGGAGAALKGGTVPEVLGATAKGAGLGVAGAAISGLAGPAAAAVLSKTPLPEVAQRIGTQAISTGAFMGTLGGGAAALSGAPLKDILRQAGQGFTSGLAVGAVFATGGEVMNYLRQQVIQYRPAAFEKNLETAGWTKLGPQHWQNAKGEEVFVVKEPGGKVAVYSRTELEDGATISGGDRQPIPEWVYKQANVKNVMPAPHVQTPEEVRAELQAQAQPVTVAQRFQHPTLGLVVVRSQQGNTVTVQTGEGKMVAVPRAELSPTAAQAPVAPIPAPTAMPAPPVPAAAPPAPIAAPTPTPTIAPPTPAPTAVPVPTQAVKPPVAPVAAPTPVAAQPLAPTPVAAKEAAPGAPQAFTPGQVLRTTGQIQLKVLAVEPNRVQVQQIVSDRGIPVEPTSPRAQPYWVKPNVLQRLAKGREAPTPVAAAVPPAPAEGTGVAVPAAPAVEAPRVATGAIVPEKPLTPETVGLPVPVSKDDIPYQLALDAYRWNSMTPETRAEQVQAEYVQHMEQLYGELKPLAETEQQQVMLKEELERYRTGLINHYRAVLAARSRTASAMVTGPANFPTARNQKALNVEQKRTEEMTAWQNRAAKAIKNKLKEARTAGQVTTAELARLKKEAMQVIGTLKAIEAGEKGINRSLFVGSLAGTLRRSADAGNVSAVRDALEFIREQQAKHLKSPVFTERHGIWKYAEQITEKPIAPTQEVRTGEELVAEYAGAQVVKNYDADRTQISFDARPGDAIIKDLRGAGWNWSPTNKAWQRKLTDNAEWSAKGILEKHLGEARTPAAPQPTPEVAAIREPLPPAPKPVAEEPAVPEGFILQSHLGRTSLATKQAEELADFIRRHDDEREVVVVPDPSNKRLRQVYASPLPEPKTAEIGEAQELRAEPTGPAPKNLAQVEVDTVDELPPEITLPNPEYAMHLFEAARQLDTPARYAALRKNVLGKFKAEEEQIGLRSIKAVATSAHELAHALDFKLSANNYPSNIRDRFPETKTSEKALRNELKAVSQIMRPVDGGPNNFNAYRRRHTELMADFYSMYLLDPDLARHTAPLASQAFEAQLNRNPKVKAVVSELIQARTVTPPVAETRLEQIIRGQIRPIEDIDALLEQAKTNPHHYEDRTLKILDAVRHVKDVVTGKRPVKSVEGRYLDAVRDTLITGSRLKTAKILDARMQAEKWRKALQKERLEDLGAAVEGIANLRTGQPAEDIKASLAPEERQILKEYRFLQEAAREELNKLVAHLQGPEYIKYVEDYLMHLYENPKQIKAYVSKWAKTPPSAKARHFPTLQDAVEAGLKPKTQNIADLHQSWAQMNFNAAINQVIVGNLREIINKEGSPILLKPDDAPPDWPRIDHPAIQRVYGHKTKDGAMVLWRGGVAVDPEAYKYIHAVFDQPFTGSVVKAVETINIFAKAVQLTLSLFHPLNLTESFVAINARLRKPLRGLIIVGGEAETLATGWRIPGTKTYITQPHRRGLKALESKAFRRDITMHGLQLEPIADAYVGRVMQGLQAAEEKTRGIFGVNHVVRAIKGYKAGFDTMLWNHYHAGGKADAYLLAVGEALSHVPDDITLEQIRTIKENVAEVINDAVGGQEWAKKFWATPKVKQGLHMAMLAPDYTISNFNIARKAFDPRYIRNPVTRRMVWMYWVAMVLGVGGAMDGVNYLATGKHIWENETDRKTVADVTPIVHAARKALGTYDPEDKRRYYAAPGKQVREVMRYLGNPLAVLGGKASPTVHMLAEQLTGHQAGSGWAMPWMEEEMGFYESIPERLKAVYEKFIPFSLRGNQFAFAMPMQRGMGWWQAQRAYEDLIRGEVDPSLYRRLIGKADYDRLKTGVDEAAELNGLDGADLWRQANTKVRGDYYSRFWEAINDQNWKEADRIGGILLELGVEPKGIAESALRREVPTEQLIEGLQAYARGVGEWAKEPKPTLYQRFELKK